jgi:organic radical activating enzyme
MHLASHPNGGQSLCCRSNHTDAVSWAMQPGTTMLQTFDNTRLLTMANSETFVRVRQAMINGEEPIECEGCWKDEAAGLVSKRMYENERWQHIIPELEQTAILASPDYRYVELRLGNVCNNACVTCNSFSSSKWYADEERISKELNWFPLRPMENFKWHDKPEFYEELADLSKDVEEIYINGGEPTLIKAHFRYLEKLIENGQAPNVHLVYSLNMMDVPDRLAELWQHFKQVSVNCSIDDYGLRNYYIRWPSDWDNTVNSIKKLNAIPTVDWHVTQTVSIYNIFTLEKLNLWLEYNFNKETTFNYVLYPDYLSLAAIPDSVKSFIKHKYRDSFSDAKRNELFAKLDMPWQPELTEKASEFVLALDKSRNLNFRSYVPDLGRIIDANTN